MTVRPRTEDRYGFLAAHYRGLRFTQVKPVFPRQPSSINILGV